MPPVQPTLPPDHRAIEALDRLIYFSEEPPRLDEAQSLLGTAPGEPPPSLCWCVDFGPVAAERVDRVAQWAGWCNAAAGPVLQRRVALAAWPHLVYVFGWLPRGAVEAPAPEGPIDELGRSAASIELPHPSIGVSHTITDWGDLRRALTRSTVASRLAWLTRRRWCAADEADRWIELPKAEPRSPSALLTALARHDRATLLDEARLVTDSLLRAYLSPLAILRTRLVQLLLSAADVARAGGVTEHQVDRWADHRLRSLWQVYSLPLLGQIAVDALAELGEIVAALDDPSLPPAVASARSLLAATWNEDLSAVQLARESGLTAVQLSRLFNQYVGCSIPAYRNRLRVEQARRLLTTTDKSIATIAFECGFANVTHFHRTFRRLTGQTPGAARDTK